MRYEKWKDIAMLSGPQGLRAIKGFKDEALSGTWDGYRSSRLNEQWRVIYAIETDVLIVKVVRVTPMTTGNADMSNFAPAKKRIEVTPGQSLRIIRELQGLSQTQLSALCGIPQTTISSIENGRVNLGVERAKVLGTALHCHPAILVFPGWGLASAA